MTYQHVQYNVKNENEHNFNYFKITFFIYMYILVNCLGFLFFSFDIVAEMSHIEENHPFTPLCEMQTKTKT